MVGAHDLIVSFPSGHSLWDHCELTEHWNPTLTLIPVSRDVASTCAVVQLLSFLQPRAGLIASLPSRENSLLVLAKNELWHTGTPWSPFPDTSECLCAWCHCAFCLHFSPCNTLGRTKSSFCASALIARSSLSLLSLKVASVFANRSSTCTFFPIIFCLLTDLASFIC